MLGVLTAVCSLWIIYLGVSLSKAGKSIQREGAPAFFKCLRVIVALYSAFALVSLVFKVNLLSWQANNFIFFLLLALWLSLERYCNSKV
jgi:hypothetical protein